MQKPSEQLKQMMSVKASHMQERMSGGQEAAGSRVKADRAQVDQVLRDWPNPPGETAEKVIEKYGLPNEVSYSKLTWYNTGPWKRTEIQRDEFPHKFPTAHTDFITQTISYRVPVEAVSAITEFDGSVLVDRTRGEMAARCDEEAMNILSLNLAHEVATGQRSVADAREKYAEQAAAYMLNRSAPYLEEFLFEVPRSDTADFDESIIGDSMLHQMGEKIKDVFIGKDTKH